MDLSTTLIFPAGQHVHELQSPFHDGATKNICIPLLSMLDQDEGTFTRQMTVDVELRDDEPNILWKTFIILINVPLCCVKTFPNKVTPHTGPGRQYPPDIVLRIL